MLDRITNDIHYTNILDFWKSYSQKWFAGEPLSQSTLTYVASSIESFDETNPLHHISKVIQYDQLLRHQPLREKLSPEHHHQSVYHAKTFIELIEPTAPEIQDWMRVFAYLAIRHSSSLDDKREALRLSLADPESSTSSTLIRFIRASVLDIDKHMPSPTPYTVHPIFPINPQILDRSSALSLEPHLVRYRSIPPKFFECLSPSQYKDGAAISISGGVDSMVLSFVVASKMRSIRKSSPPLILIHISYNNRVDDCPHERNFLSIWTEFIREHVYPNTILYIREITELTRRRESKYRAMYEEVTRTIRYNYYANVINKHSSSIPIFMGHNSDDTLENVFSNLSKCIHPENLRGMSLETIDDHNELRIIRPFLNITKNEIYEFSKKFSIPYLWDSTPSWSKRGQMRDKLIPSIREFNAPILSGLTHMSDTMGWLYTEWLQSIKEGAETAIRYTNNDILIPRNTTFPGLFERNATRLEFWTQLWFIVCRSVARPSNKAFQTFITYFSRTPSKGHLHLSKQADIIWTDQSVIIRIHPPT